MRTNLTEVKYRHNLPQLSGDLFLTDGGIETTLIFHDGFNLPEFAAFVLLKNDEGRKALVDYYNRYVKIAKNHDVSFILESPTWRANQDWGSKIGYSSQELVALNQEAIHLLSSIRKANENGNFKLVISGCIGPRGDGYQPDSTMIIAEAEAYHAWQMNVMADTQVDMVTALTMTYAEEAIGVVLAARSAGLPVIISFTVETDGRLPNGQSLKDAILQVDKATWNGPAYYMVNCAHPTHFESVLDTNESWVQRIRGLRSNASKKSHAELNESDTLDDGNPLEFSQQYRTLWDHLPSLNVLGGCCGTDHRHIEAVCKAIVQ